MRKHERGRGEDQSVHKVFSAAESQGRSIPTRASSANLLVIVSMLEYAWSDSTPATLPRTSLGLLPVVVCRVHGQQAEKTWIEPDFGKEQGC